MAEDDSPLIGSLLRSSGLGALAATLAMLALPAEALAQSADGGQRWRSGGSTVQAPRSDGGQRWRSTNGNRNSWNRGTIPQQADTGSSQPGWRDRMRDEQGRGDQPSSGSGLNRGDSAPSGDQTRRQADNRWRDGNDNWNGRRADGRDDRREWRNTERSRDSTDNRWRDGNRDWRNADNRWREDRRSWNGRRDRWRDNDHNWHGRNAWSGDYRRWDRNWRKDNRYDWRHYRSRHHGIYRIGRYYPPYRNHYYSRLYVGFFLDPLFYSIRYWIDDPWHYRLPAAYGPYRWIRYYDDALLVNIYTGEVIDVIYDFFW